jgi:DNA-binding NarL/FixJ family response regulator
MGEINFRDLIPSEGHDPFTSFRLSKEEKQILLFKADGLTTKEISAHFMVTEYAMRKRITRLVKRYNCKSASQLLYQLSQKGQL